VLPSRVDRSLGDFSIWGIESSFLILDFRSLRVRPGGSKRWLWLWSPLSSRYRSCVLPCLTLGAFFGRSPRAAPPGSGICKVAPAGILPAAVIQLSGFRTVPVYPIKNKEAIPYISKVGISLEKLVFLKYEKSQLTKMRTGFRGVIVV